MYHKSSSLAKGDNILLFSWKRGAYRHPWLAKIHVNRLELKIHFQFNKHTQLRIFKF